MKPFNLKLRLFRLVINFSTLFALQAFRFECERAGRKNSSLEAEKLSKIQVSEPEVLHNAASKGTVKEVQIILKGISDFTEENKRIFLNSVFHGTTALGKAIKRGDKQIVECLVQEKHVDVNKTGEGPSLLLALTCKHPKVAEVLLTVAKRRNKKLNVTAIDSASQNTALHLAAQEGYLGVVKLLLDPKHKVDVNTANNARKTPLQLASTNGHLDVVKCLVQKATDDDVRNVLVLAVTKGKLGVVKTILHANKYANKIDLNAQYENGKLLLDQLIDLASTASTASTDHLDILKCLVEEVTDEKAINLLFSVAGGEEDNGDAIEAILAAKPSIDVNTKDKKGKYDQYESAPLHLAAKNNNTAVLKRLLAHPKINVNIKDKDEDTPLHLAARRGNGDSVELLLQSSDIDVNRVNSDKRTALHEAARKGRDQVVEQLVKAQNINVNVQDNDGNTPFHLAASEGLVETLIALLQHKGIDWNQQNNDGKTVLLCLPQGLSESDRQRIRQEWAKYLEDKWQKQEQHSNAHRKKLRIESSVHS